MQKTTLALLLLLVPACNFRKKGFGIFKPNPVVPVEVAEDVLSSKEELPEDITSYDYISDKEKDSYDESVDAFVMDDKDVLFNENNEVLDPASADNLDLVAEEDESFGDSYKDSAVHGLKTIYYDFGKPGVKPDQKSALEDNIQVVKGLVDKGYTIVLEGHACNSAGSSDARNITISEERPQIIADKLVSSGVSSEKIKVVGRGAEMKIVPHGDRVQQAPNRRVEFYAYSK